MTKIKDKGRILKVRREKQQFTYKGISIRLSSDFSPEIVQVRREWQDIFKVMKGRKKKTNPRILYLERQGFYAYLMERSKLLQTNKS